MKKVLSIALILGLLLSCVSAAAEPEKRYDKHVSFTASQMSQITEGGDYTHDAVYYKLQELFNFDWTLYAVDNASWHEKDTMWITAGTMPDVTFVDFDATEYQTYAEQGLIKALPDGWEEKYPNLAGQINATGIADAIKIDGKTYCVPHTIIYLVGPENFVFAFHDLMYYRIDWAKELGYNWGVSTTMAEFEQYLTDAEAKYGCKGMVTMSGPKPLIRQFMFQFNKGYRQIYKDDSGKYVLGFAQDGTIEGIKHLREMYEKGLFDPEFYLGADGGDFPIGKAAAIDYWGGPVHPQSIAQWYLTNTNDESIKTLEDMKKVLGTVTITDNNGVYHAGNTKSNTCFATYFSPELDDETFDRILAMYDYFATLEGFELTQLGIRGVDWDKDDNGNYTLLCPEILNGTYSMIREKYPSMYYLYLRNVLSDSAAYIDPSVDPYWRKMSDDMYTFRGASDLIPFDVDYSFYQGDAKSNYSVDWDGEVMALILDSSLDIETEVNRFIEENRPLWEPLVNELNEKFAQ